MPQPPGAARSSIQKISFFNYIGAAAAGIALPECFLGLVPGWGGAYLVPNLIGIERAVTLVLQNPLSQNRMLDGRSAYALGLADAMFDGADFLERSLDWAGQVVSGAIAVERDPVDRTPHVGVGAGRGPGSSWTPRSAGPRRRRTARSTAGGRRKSTAPRRSRPRTRRWPT